MFKVINIDSEKLTKFCHDTGATMARKETIIPFYASHSKPHILNGFFAKKIVLVEGETEEFALPIYLDSIGLDTLKEGIAVIGVGGKGNLAKWWRLFTCYGIPMYVCFDNDEEDDNSGTKRKDALKALGIDIDEFESILAVDDWNISKYFCVFGKDFESTLRNSFEVYQAVEKEEKNRLGSSNKPIIARAVAERLVSTEKVEEDIGWRKLALLGKRIKNL